jgi:small-conductance mechanosensitive channel
MRFSRFTTVVIVLTLCACQRGDSKRPQDKKMQEQQQKLDMAIKKLEAEADKVVQQGEQMYREAMRSAKQFSEGVEKQAQGVVRSAEQVADEAQKLGQLPGELQQKSEQLVQAARTAIEQVKDEFQASPQQETPGLEVLAIARQWARRSDRLRWLGVSRAGVLSGREADLHSLRQLFNLIAC